MNDNILTFGKKHYGRLVEEVVFDDPNYINWMLQEDIPNQRTFSDGQRVYFNEVVLRASHLSGGCEACSDQTVSRCGVTRNRYSAKAQDTWLLCHRCDCPGNFMAGYYPASLLFASDDFSAKDQKKIRCQIREKFFNGVARPSNGEIQRFFAKDSNFKRPTPEFFREYIGDEEWLRINGRGELHLMA